MPSHAIPSSKNVRPQRPRRHLGPFNHLKLRWPCVIRRRVDLASSFLEDKLVLPGKGVKFKRWDTLMRDPIDERTKQKGCPNDRVSHETRGNDLLMMGCFQRDQDSQVARRHQQQANTPEISWKISHTIHGIGIFTYKLQEWLVFYGKSTENIPSMGGTRWSPFDRYKWSCGAPINGRK